MQILHEQIRAEIKTQSAIKPEITPADMNLLFEADRNRAEAQIAAYEKMFSKSAIVCSALVRKVIDEENKSRKKKPQLSLEQAERVRAVASCLFHLHKTRLLQAVGTFVRGDYIHRMFSDALESMSNPEVKAALEEEVGKRKMAGHRRDIVKWEKEFSALKKGITSFKERTRQGDLTESAELLESIHLVNLMHVIGEKAAKEIGEATKSAAGNTFMALEHLIK